jgi:BirA family biotin operon repressor/biotin-[acetyl-CoA-carboxylase] ligase
MDVFWEGRTALEWQEVLGVPAVQLFDVTASTNDVALRLAEAGAATMTLVVADHQTSGRGRSGGEWASAPGSSLLCSLVFQTELGPDHAPGTAPIRIGAALARAVEQLIDQPVGVKWPNDVVIPRYGKIAGILCEGAFRQQGRGHIVAGIGVNVFYPGDDFASIADATDEPPTRGALLQALMRELAAIAPRITQTLSADELLQLRERDLLFDQDVKTESGLMGRARGIAEDGALMLDTGDGVKAIHSATVRLADNEAYPGTDT